VNGHEAQNLGLDKVVYLFIFFIKKPGCASNINIFFFKNTAGS
jgi:hypothetical protein